MKRTFSLALFLAAILTARADFVVQQKIESPMQNGDVTMKMKGDKVRLDMSMGPAGALSTIIDVNTGDAVVLMHSQKMAMKISAEQMKQSMEMMKKHLGDNSNAP